MAYYLIKKFLSSPPLICLGASVIGSCIFLINLACPFSNTQEIIFIPLPIFQISLLLFYLFAVYIFRHSKNIWQSYLPLLVIFFVYFYGLTNRDALGDHDLLIAHAFDPNISIAEPLAYFLYKLIIKLTENASYLNLIAPIFGIFSVLSYFMLTHKLGGMVHIQGWIFKLALISIPLPFFYTYGYIENTQLSTPFFIAFLWASLHYLSAKKIRVEWISWISLSLFLSMAILTHGQNWFVMPSILILPFIKDISLTYKNYVVKIFFSISIFLALSFVTYKISMMQGWQFFPGSALGGGDGLRFVPLSTSELNKYATFTMFSISHAVQISSIIVFSGFYILSTPVILLHRVLKGSLLDRMNVVYTNPAVIFLAITSLGYLSFIALWNFDFGFPADIDLMLTMGVSLSLSNVITINKLIENNTLKAILISLSGLLSLWFLSALQTLR